jgi:hypothetical protein
MSHSITADIRALHIPIESSGKADTALEEHLPALLPPLQIRDFDMNHLAVYCGSCLLFLRYAESERKKRQFFCKDCMQKRRKDANTKKNQQIKNEKQLHKCGIILSTVKDDTSNVICNFEENNREQAQVSLDISRQIIFTSRRKRLAVKSGVDFPVLSLKKERKQGM